MIPLSLAVVRCISRSLRVSLSSSVCLTSADHRSIPEARPPDSPETQAQAEGISYSVFNGAKIEVRVSNGSQQNDAGKLMMRLKPAGFWSTGLKCLAPQAKTDN